MLGTMLAHHLSGERYRMGIDGGTITLTVSRALYEHLLEEGLSKRQDLKVRLLEIRSGLYTNIVRFELVLPFISLPNRAHKKIGWKTLWERAEQLGFLLELCNFFATEGDCSQFLLSKHPQLMAVSTGCLRESSISGCPIEVGFSQEAFDILAEECKENVAVDEAERHILTFYSGMSSQTTKEAVLREKEFLKYSPSFVGIRAMVRAGGTPHFLVPGNCACLGANPDEFKWSLSMHSHNMDSPLQQLSMLAGIISFWNDFLTPKWQAKQNA